VARSPASELAADAVPSYRTAILGRLHDASVAFITEHDVLRVEKDGLVLINNNGEKRRLEADTVVVARGSVPETIPTEGLRTKVKEVYLIGDCVEPRTIAEALYEAALVANSI
jgi:pyruvate/2-oxoglutarate dehydrogenase complex dihydrolipoamide dehydrogenase (E3) component